MTYCIILASDHVLQLLTFFFLFYLDIGMNFMAVLTPMILGLVMKLLWKKAVHTQTALQQKIVLSFQLKSLML